MTEILSTTSCVATASRRRRSGVAARALRRRRGDVAAPSRRRRSDLVQVAPTSRRRRDDAKPISLASISCSQHFRAAIVLSRSIGTIVEIEISAASYLAWPRHVLWIRFHSQLSSSSPFRNRVSREFSLKSKSVHQGSWPCSEFDFNFDFHLALDLEIEINQIEIETEFNKHVNRN